jgi:hypothetical protein
MKTCLSLKSLKSFPSRSWLIFLCDERNAHCFGKICLEVSRKEVKLDVLEIGME